MKKITSPDYLLPNLYDSHCHLFLLREQGLDILQILQQWRSKGLDSLLNIVLEPEEEDWLWHLEIVRACNEEPELYPKVLLACGIHPQDAEGSSSSRYPPATKMGVADFDRKVLEPSLERLAQRAASKHIYAIGETGLDYYHSKENKHLQQKSLEFHIRLAQQYRKPLIVHNRDSDSDIGDLLGCRQENQLPAGGIMHCFSGSPILIEALLDKGFYFSFAGNITYKNAENLRQAAALVPIERLLIETDAPFLAPQPVRGQINHPGFIGHTLEVLAQCHKQDLQSMSQQLQQNWLTLFPLFGCIGRSPEFHG